MTRNRNGKRGNGASYVRNVPKKIQDYYNGLPEAKLTEFIDGDDEMVVVIGGIRMRFKKSKDEVVRNSNPKIKVSRQCQKKN